MDVWVLKENKHCSLHVFPVCHPPSCYGPEELNHHTVVTEGGLQFRPYDSTPGHILSPSVLWHERIEDNLPVPRYTAVRLPQWVELSYLC